MEIGAIIGAIEEEQRSLARSSLSSPGHRDAFEFGRISGMYQGLERAKQLIDSLHKDREAKLNRL